MRNGGSFSVDVLRQIGRSKEKTESEMVGMDDNESE